MLSGETNGCYAAYVKEADHRFDHLCPSCFDCGDYDESGVER